MDTITIASSRGFSMSDIEILIVSAIIIAALAATVLSGLKHLRARHHHEPRI